MRLEFPFSGLPLEIRDDGACGIFCDGTADIESSRDGRWHVAGVKVRLGLHRSDTPSAYRLETPSLWVMTQIMTTLEHSPHWHDLVTKHIERAGLVVNLEDRRFQRAYRQKVEV